MRNFLEKPKPVLVRTGQTWLLKTGLKQFGYNFGYSRLKRAAWCSIYWWIQWRTTKTWQPNTDKTNSKRFTCSPADCFSAVFYNQSLARNFKLSLDDHGASLTANDRNYCWVQPGHISAQECFKSACYGKYWRFCVKRAVKSVSKGVRRGFACVGDTG